MNTTIFISMLSFSFVLSISPGPVNIMILSSSINYGFKKSFSFISGATIGFTILLAIIALGFENFLTKSEYLSIIVELFGACFIIYIGYKIMSSNKFELKDDKEVKYLKFYEGFLLQWFNPKAWLACISGVSMFSSSKENLYIFIILYFIVCYLCLSFWGILGNKLILFFNSQFKLRVFNFFMGMILVVLALLIILSRIFSF